MSGDLKRTFSRPPGPSGPVRQYYLPDEYYFVDTKAFPFEHFTRVTVLYLARWADHYLAGAVGEPTSQKAGQIPPTSKERDELLNDLIGWLDGMTSGLPYNSAFSLYAGEQPILDQHDGVPGVLAITPPQFEELQRCWIDADLPSDLYYLAHHQRSVVEPVRLFGGVVRMIQRYSPLRWAHRAPSTASAIPVPTEGEREAQFEKECWSFHEALMRRYMEASEPGKEHDRDFLTRLVRLDVQVRKIMSTGLGNANEMESR